MAFSNWIKKFGRNDKTEEPKTEELRIKEEKERREKTEELIKKVNEKHEQRMKNSIIQVIELNENRIKNNIVRYALSDIMNQLRDPSYLPGVSVKEYKEKAEEIAKKYVPTYTKEELESFSIEKLEEIMEKLDKLEEKLAEKNIIDLLHNTSAEEPQL